MTKPMLRGALPFLAEAAFISLPGYHIRELVADESDLFEHAHEQASEGAGALAGPLAHRMRPRTLDEFMGQERVLGPGKPLRSWVATDRVPSLILWGPPGTGKTT